MRADPELVQFLDDFSRAYATIYDRPLPINESIVQDLLTLAHYLLTADAYGKRTEKAFIAEMITHFRLLQPNMPYEYNLSVTDGFLQSELAKLAAEPAESLNEDTIRRLNGIRALEAWAQTYGKEDKMAHQFIEVFQALLIRLVSRDGQFSDAESTFLKQFDTYFARYARLAPAAITATL